MNKGLSKRRRAILDCIGEHVRTHGFPPTVREIGEAVGLCSSSTVHGHIYGLIEAGLLIREPYLTRALRLPQAEVDPIAAGRRMYEALYPGADWGAMGVNGQQAYVEAAARYDGRPLPGRLKAAA